MPRLRLYLSALALASSTGCAAPALREEPDALARALAAEGRFAEAAAEIERAVEEDPDDPELRREAARIEWLAGDMPRGILHLEEALEQEPGNAELWLDLGIMEQSRENLQDAYVAFRRASELAPDDLRAIAGLALTADGLGFDEEAAAAYARWNELEGRDPAREAPGGAAPR
jgi:Flp pilus assembly protein TadD